MRDASSDGLCSRCINHGVLGFQDEDHPDADLALTQMRSEEAVVPCLWWFEVRNILVVKERRRRIAESDTAAFLVNLPRLRIRIDRAPDEGAVLRLARTQRLSVYDAAIFGVGATGGITSCHARR